MSSDTHRSYRRAASSRPTRHYRRVDQLRVRHQLTADACDRYREAAFSVVARDVILGPHLQLMIGLIRSRPLYVVVLAPRAEVVAERERRRSKNSYQRWTVDLLDRGLRHDTPRLGLWLDTSDLTPGQTVDEILSRLPEALVAG